MFKVMMGFFMMAGILFSPLVHGNAEAAVVAVKSNGGNYKVNIDDSSIYMVGKNHAHVIITPYYARWNPSYPVEVLWGKGFAVYRLDKNGNRKGMESDDFALAIANYMSEHY